jgi:multidrug resistance efflux pump
MAESNRTIIGIFIALVVIIAAALGWWWLSRGDGEVP